MSHPAEAKPWYEYRKIFLTEGRADAGVAFWREHVVALERAASEYGVDPEIIVAIIGVETFYGQRTGKYRVINALATLGFDYPPRAVFFRKELAQYLLLARDEGWDMLDPLGSYAGAMGMGQFIPSSYRMYAVDFSGDGKRDLWNSVDAIGSVANYFRRHGWALGEGVATRAADGQTDDVIEGLKTDPKPSYDRGVLSRQGLLPEAMPEGEGPFSVIALEAEEGMEYWIGQNNFYVITRYNRSPLYAMAVYQLSQEIKRRYQQKLAQDS
jgi:membrane-bound lytic murein transglycosylase B